MVDDNLNKRVLSEFVRKSGAFRNGAGSGAAADETGSGEECGSGEPAVAGRDDVIDPRGSQLPPHDGSGVPEGS